jgi:hypothetical protein
LIFNFAFSLTHIDIEVKWYVGEAKVDACVLVERECYIDDPSTF